MLSPSCGLNNTGGEVSKYPQGENVTQQEDEDPYPGRANGLRKFQLFELQFGREELVLLQIGIFVVCK